MSQTLYVYRQGASPRLVTQAKVQDGQIRCASPALAAWIDLAWRTLVEARGQPRTEQEEARLAAELCALRGNQALFLRTTPLP